MNKICTDSAVFNTFGHLKNWAKLKTDLQALQIYNRRV